MFVVDERIDDRGAARCTRLETVPGGLRVVVGEEEAGFVSLAALDAVMARYGKPLAEDVTPRGPSLDLGDGRALHRLRHLARYDVIARDFIVLVRPEREPLAELATTIAGALVHLARAHAARGG